MLPCKITIITVCYNSAVVLEETIKSVFKQDYKDIEYIIIDGASKDDTNLLLMKYSKIFDEANRSYYYVSEKDTGIYNAMNKGLKKSTGKFVMFLNAGDVLAYKSAITDMIRNASEQSEIIYGNHFGRIKNKAKRSIPKEIDKIIECSVFCHQAVLTKLELLIKNPFNEEYRIIADYDFFLKEYLTNAKFQYVNVDVVYYDLNGLSQTGIIEGKKENIAIRLKNKVIRQEDIQKEIIKIKKIILKHKAKKIIPTFIRTYKYENVGLNYLEN